MSRRPTYYVIELSSGWLTALVVAAGLLVVLAFALGYGAAAKAAGTVPSRGGVGAVTPTPAVVTADVEAPPATVVVSEATPVPAEPTITPGAGWERPPTSTPESSATPEPPATATPAPTSTPMPAPTATPEPEERVEGIWVQVLATRSGDSVRSARQQLEGLGFPAEHQRVVSTPVADGSVMYKVRVGPFPSRDSADRVVRRMQAAGFADAWVVTP